MHSSAKSQNDVPQTDWGCCPPGELQRLVGKLNVIEHCAKRKRICFCGIGAVLLAVGLIVGAASLLISDMPSDGGLTCQQCQSHFRAYHAHLADSSDHESIVGIETGSGTKTEIMDSVLAEKMKTHLANCPHCRSRFNTRYPGILTNHRGSNLGHDASMAWFSVGRVPMPI